MTAPREAFCFQQAPSARLPAAMSAVCAGLYRGIAEKVDAFIRPPAFALEIHNLTGCRVGCGNNFSVISCSAEVAIAVWRTYDRVLVDARQYIQIDGRRCWSEVMESGVKWTGQAFPVYFRSTHEWLGRAAVIDAEYTVTVFVPAARLWEHRRWRAVGGAEPEDPLRDTSDAPPIAHGEVAGIIAELEADDSDSDEDL